MHHSAGAGSRAQCMTGDEQSPLTSLTGFATMPTFMVAAVPHYGRIGRVDS